MGIGFGPSGFLLDFTGDLDEDGLELVFIDGLAIDLFKDEDGLVLLLIDGLAIDLFNSVGRAETGLFVTDYAWLELVDLKIELTGRF